MDSDFTGPRYWNLRVPVPDARLGPQNCSSPFGVNVTPRNSTAIDRTVVNPNATFAHR